MAKVGVDGWKIAAGTEVFFFGQFSSLILLSITRSQSQQSTCKDLKPKWPKPSHLGLRPLTLRLLSAPARAHTKTDRWVGGLFTV